MNTVMSQEMLQNVFDEVTRVVTETVAGIRIYPGDFPLGENVYTVYAAFERGFHSSLAFCADASVFVRLAQNIIQSPRVTPRDVEDFAKEYFNVLCGNVASKIFQATRVPSRFEVPHFCHGRYGSENLQEHFVISYFSERNEGVQLIHLVPKKLIERGETL